MKCSDCPQRFCDYRNVLEDKCWYVDEHLSTELSELIVSQIIQQIKPQMKRFWMVYVDGASSPQVKHEKEQEAVKEAERLAEKTGKTTYVLMAIEAMERFTRIDHIAL